MDIKAGDFSNIVILTGAGISAESGLKTFRDADGLWEGHRVEDVATPEAFANDPETVYRFYNARRAQLVSSAKPNAAHSALADFERRFEGEFLVVTQNVDDLHEQAGSQNVLHMHGELKKARCLNCGAITHTDTDFDDTTTCPVCHQTGDLRPDIVWFGEIPKYMSKIESALSRASLFVSIGTSGNVYPAAGFVQLANHCGAMTVELNLAPSTTVTQFQLALTGSATELVPRFFN